jgi:hypothetical protein
MRHLQSLLQRFDAILVQNYVVQNHVVTTLDVTYLAHKSSPCVEIIRRLKSGPCWRRWPLCFIPAASADGRSRFERIVSYGLDATWGQVRRLWITGLISPHFPNRVTNITPASRPSSDAPGTRKTPATREGSRDHSVQLAVTIVQCGRDGQIVRM